MTWKQEKLLEQLDVVKSLGGIDPVGRPELIGGKQK